MPPVPAEFLAELSDGSKIYLQYRETIGLSVLARGGFEDHEVQTLASFIGPNSVVVDVGANIGIMSIRLARALPSASIWAVEPVERNRVRLQKNATVNMLTNVEVIMAACANFDGEIEIVVPPDAAYATTTPSARRELAPANVAVVAARRLDGMWKDRGSPLVSVIKVDVEGGELSVLRGAQDLIRACRPIVMFEANDLQAKSEVEDWFQSMNYVLSRPLGFAPYNYLARPVDSDDTEALV